MLRSAAFRLGFALLSAGGLLPAADWPTYRGPELTGVSPAEVLKPWSGPARIAWSRPVGIGVSAVTVVGDRAFTMGNEDNRDVITCLAVADGNPVWSQSYPCKFEKRSFEGGTTATPTIVGDRVYVASYDGQIACLQQTDGQVVWRRHLVDDFGGRPPKWKYAGSPCVVDGLVIFDTGAAGASTLALDAATGEKRWVAGDQEAGYATPIPCQLGDTAAVLLFKPGQLIAVERAGGRLLWSIPWRVPWDVNASSPVVVGTTLVVSSGYDKAEIGGRAIAYELGAREPRQLWRNDDVKTRFGSCAVSGGRVFAVSESTGGVLCLDLATGVEKWRQPHTKFGNLVVAGGHLVVLGDTGELLLAPVAGDGFQPLCRTELPKGKYWVQPTVAGGRIYCRSNQGVVTAVDCR